LLHHLWPEMSDFQISSWHGLKACSEATRGSPRRRMAGEAKSGRLSPNARDPA
jgi:hypothetical protein